MTTKTIDTTKITPQMWAAFAKNWRTTIDKTNLPDHFMAPILALLEAAPIAKEEYPKLSVTVTVDPMPTITSELRKQILELCHIAYEHEEESVRMLADEVERKITKNIPASP